MKKVLFTAAFAAALVACGSPSGNDGGSGGGSGGSGGGSGGGGGGAGAPTCDSYCTAIMANCTGGNAQFPNQGACLGTCSAWTQGTTGATTGNTLACRAYHADAAPQDAALHCPHAGPGGAGACGTNCEGFCTVATAKCGAQHTSAGTCATDCAAFPDGGVNYNAGTTTGNSFSCRLYHLSVAATDSASATTHCPHTTTASAAGACQ